jgi:hypothetical protein
MVWLTRIDYYYYTHLAQASMLAAVSRQRNTLAHRHVTLGDDRVIVTACNSLLRMTLRAPDVLKAPSDLGKTIFQLACSLLDEHNSSTNQITINHQLRNWRMHDVIIIRLSVETFQTMCYPIVLISTHEHLQ